MFIYSLIKQSNEYYTVISHYWNEAHALKAKDRANAKNRGGESTFHVIEQKIKGKIYVVAKDVEFVKNKVKIITDQVENN